MYAYLLQCESGVDYLRKSCSVIGDKDGRLSLGLLGFNSMALFFRTALILPVVALNLCEFA